MKKLLCGLFCGYVLACVSWSAPAFACEPNCPAVQAEKSDAKNYEAMSDDDLALLGTSVLDAKALYVLGMRGIHTKNLAAIEVLTLSADLNDIDALRYLVRFYSEDSDEMIAARKTWNVEPDKKAALAFALKGAEQDPMLYHTAGTLYLETEEKTNDSWRTGKNYIKKSGMTLQDLEAKKGLNAADCLADIKHPLHLVCTALWRPYNKGACFSECELTIFNECDPDCMGGQAFLDDFEASLKDDNATLEDTLKLMEKIAEEGNKNAQFLLTVLYTAQGSETENMEKGFYWRAKAAEQDVEVAQSSMAMSYMKPTEKADPQGRDITIEDNPQKAQYWLERAAKDGSAASVDFLIRYHTGRMEILTHNIDYARALDVALEAAKTKDVFYLQAAMLYSVGGHGLEKDEAKAREMLAKLSPNAAMLQHFLAGRVQECLDDASNPYHFVCTQVIGNP